MKRFICIISAALVLLSCFTFCVSAKSSESNVPRLVDDADIIPDSDEKEILNTLDSISENRNFDVVILTVYSTEGEDIGAFAESYYDDNHFGYGKKCDGVLLIISMNPEEVWVSTCGKGTKIIKNHDELINSFADYLSSGDYSKACRIYAEKVDSKISSSSKRPIILIPVALVLGFLISSLIIGGYKSKHKTVRRKVEAASYEVKNSLVLENKSDTFLYSNVKKTPIPQNNTRSSGGGGTHVSASGNTHGGGGMSF